MERKVRQNCLIVNPKLPKLKLSENFMISDNKLETSFQFNKKAVDIINHSYLMEVVILN